MTTAFKTWDRAKLIPIDRLVFSDWNWNVLSPECMAVLTEDIESGMFDEALQVLPLEDEKFLVLNGEHRAKVAKSLDMTEVPCVIRTDLIGKTRADLICWSGRRNNIRGRINREKYIEAERELDEHHGLQREAARRRMLMDEERIKALKLAHNPANPDDDDVNTGPEGSESSGTGPETDGERDLQEEKRAKAKLQKAVKAALTTALDESKDTVEHGYVFFQQGDQEHLVVDMPKNLYGLVKRMVSVCKDESAPVADFLTAAITNELTRWE